MQLREVREQHGKEGLHQKLKIDRFIIETVDDLLDSAMAKEHLSSVAE